MGAHLVPVGLLAVLCACSLGSEKARIPVSGSGLVLVLKEDEKRMTRCVVDLQGETVSSQGFLGSGRGEIGRDPQVTSDEGRLRIAWGEQRSQQAAGSL